MNVDFSNPFSPLITIDSWTFMFIIYFVTIQAENLTHRHILYSATREHHHYTRKNKKKKLITINNNK